MARIRAVIFDLDGTLVDSLSDIGAALATALTQHGLSAPSVAQLKAMIGEGARVLAIRPAQGIGIGGRGLGRQGGGGADERADERGTHAR